MLNKMFSDADLFPKLSSNRLWFWGGADTSGASDQIAQAQANSIAAQERMFEKAAGFEKPFREAGTGAVNQWAGLLGIPGYTALDPTQTLMNTPGYQFLQDQGTQALSRYGAATGLSLSGPAAKSAQNFGQNLAQTYAWNPYMSSLQSLSGLGQQAAGMSGNWAVQTGAGEANTYNTMGQLQAQLEMAKANSQNAGMSDIFSGLGFLGGIAMAPWTGGSSLLGSAASGLSGLFSGGGSAGGGGMSGNYSGVWPSSGGGFSGMYPGYTLMAEGGEAESGRPYIVGEKGPELFIPRSSGTVVPNWALTDNVSTNYSGLEY